MFERLARQSRLENVMLMIFAAYTATRVIELLVAM